MRNLNVTDRRTWDDWTPRDYVRARAVLRRMIRDEPDDHWLWTSYGLTYYERFRYADALGIFRHAESLCPRCPLVQYDLALCLRMLDRDAEAAGYFRRILRRGERRLAHGTCGEGVRWARWLIKDCREMLDPGKPPPEPTLSGAR